MKTWQTHIDLNLDVLQQLMYSKKDLLDANDNNFSPLTKNNSQFYTTAFGDCYLDS